MPDVTELMTAIVDRDAAVVREHVLRQEFILINVVDETEQDEAEQMGALTAEVNDFDTLVIFTSQQTAARFVESKADMFENQGDVTGYFVPGETLLEFLPTGFGLLIDAESEETQVVDPQLVTEILSGDG